MGNNSSGEHYYDDIPPRVLVVSQEPREPRAPPVALNPSEQSVVAQYKEWGMVDRVVIITYLLQPGDVKTRQVGVTTEQAELALNSGNFLPGARGKQLEEKWRARGKVVSLHTALDTSGIRDALAKVTRKSRIILIGNVGVQSSFDAVSNQVKPIPILQGTQGTNMPSDPAETLAKRLAGAMADLKNTSPSDPLLISLYREKSSNNFSVDLLRALSKQNIYVSIRSVNHQNSLMPCALYFHQTTIRQVMFPSCPPLKA